MVVMLRTKAVHNNSKKSIKCFESSFVLLILHSVQKSVFQHYYQSYCNYLRQISCMDKNQYVFKGHQYLKQNNGQQ